MAAASLFDDYSPLFWPASQIHWEMRKVESPILCNTTSHKHHLCETLFSICWHCSSFKLQHHKFLTLAEVQNIVISPLKIRCEGDAGGFIKPHYWSSLWPCFYGGCTGGRDGGKWGPTVTSWKIWIHHQTLDVVVIVFMSEWGKKKKERDYSVQLIWFQKEMSFVLIVIPMKYFWVNGP